MACIIDLKVIPQSGKQLVKLDKQSRLCCYLKSAPERGMANKELVKFLAKTLRIAQADIEIIAGLTSRNKRLKIAGDMCKDTLLEKLGIEKQLSMFDT